MNDKLFNPDYLKHLCEKFGLRPAKQYGQNFLINPEVINSIIATARLKKIDTIVEIGPGFGVLTFALCAQVKKVLAFEIEKKLQPYWADKTPKNLEIIWGNILKIFNIEILKNYHVGNYKVVANLPYSITSAVIRLFLTLEKPPSEIILMVQKEVAERLCAPAGDTSVLSLAVQYFGKPEIVAGVLKNNFWPEPQVDSAVLKITPYKKRQNQKETDYFFKVVHTGFAQKRKLLIKNLLSIAGKQYREEIMKIFVNMGLSTTVRAQELSLEQWLLLTDRLKI